VGAVGVLVVAAILTLGLVTAPPTRAKLLSEDSLPT